MAEDVHPRLVLAFACAFVSVCALRPVASAQVGIPPADPCPTMEISVHFSPESAALEGETADVLNAAAAAARSCGDVLVVSRGYGETLSLAEHRARNVHDALLSRGVPVRDSVTLACHTAANAEGRAVVTIFFPIPTLPSPNLQIPC